MPEHFDTSSLPKIPVSHETLLYFGLNQDRADQIWEQWNALTPSTEPLEQNMLQVDFGNFVRGTLKALVDAEDCDTGEDEIDWSPYLRRIGANEQLVDAIAGQGEDYDGVRLTKSAAEWVDGAIEMRWEWLVYVRARIG